MGFWELQKANSWKEHLFLEGIAGTQMAPLSFRCLSLMF
jgi:hypothetical protein